MTATVGGIPISMLRRTGGSVAPTPAMDIDFRTGAGFELLTLVSASTHSGTAGPYVLDASGVWLTGLAGYPKGLRGARKMTGIAGSPAAGLQTDGNGKPYWSLGSGNGFSWYDAAGLPLAGVTWRRMPQSISNRFLNSHVPVTQTLATAAAGSYMCWLTGAGTVNVTGAATGSFSAGVPFLFTLGGTSSVTFTVVGGPPTQVQVQLFGAGAYYPDTESPILQTAGAANALAAETCSVPFVAAEYATGTIVIDVLQVTHTLIQKSLFLTPAAANFRFDLRGCSIGTARPQSAIGNGTTVANLQPVVTVAAGQPLRTVTRWNAGQTRMRTNGVELSSVTGFLPGAETVAYLGGVSAGGQWDAPVHRYRVWKLELSDSQVAALP